MPNRFAAVPLLLALPLIWRFGYALAARATRDRKLARVLGVGAAFSAWLLAIHALGLIAKSFYFGLFGGTLLVAAFGLLSFAWRLPGDPRLGFPRWPFWLGLVVAVGLLLGPELGWSEHDECLVAGHIAMPLQIQNGIYPPRHLTFPQFEYRYHYASDLAGAVTSTLLGRLDMQASVHLLTLLLWAYAFWLFWVIGERLIGGARAGPLTAFGVLFAGGAPFFCRYLHPLSRYLTSDCAPANIWITPPVISNFLQHPWSLGIPLFACLLLLFPTKEEDLHTPAWWALLSLLVLLLSLAEIVLFLCFVPSIVAIGSLEGWRPQTKRVVRFLPWGAAMLLLARTLHGFFAPTLEPKGAGISVHPFLMQTSLAQWASWHVQAFGLLIPLAFIGFRFFKGDRRLLALLLLGSLLVRNVFTYAHSWDIVKFSMVSQLGMAVFAAAAITQGFTSTKRRLPAAIAFALVISFGVAWPSALAFNLPELFFCKSLEDRPSLADQQAIAWLRGRVGAREGVFRSERPETYALYGGLPQTSWDWGVESFGFSNSLYEARKHLVSNVSPLALQQQDFRWVVVSPADTGLSKALESWVQNGQAEMAVEFPPLKIYKLRP